LANPLACATLWSMALTSKPGISKLPANSSTFFFSSGTLGSTSSALQHLCCETACCGQHVTTLSCQRSNTTGCEMGAMWLIDRQYAVKAISCQQNNPAVQQSKHQLMHCTRTCNCILMRTSSHFLPSYVVATCADQFMLKICQRVT